LEQKKIILMIPFVQTMMRDFGAKSFRKHQTRLNVSTGGGVSKLRQLAAHISATAGYV
jgi:hypothetical protein